MPDTELERDEGIRPDTSVEKLAKLKPAFRKDGTVTAGNASPLNDGAAATLIGDERAAEALGREPLARIVSRGVHGVDPDVFGIAPVRATEIALERAGIGWDDVAVVELNEAFASQSLACLAGWEGLDPDKLNPNGGAIALGHPLGASGVRVLGDRRLRAQAPRRRLRRRHAVHRRRPGRLDGDRGMSGADDGERTRREVLGDEHVDRAQAKTTPLTEPFQDYITKAAWGDVWGRPGLDRRMRSAITLALLTQLRAEEELAMHIRAAIRNGLTRGRDRRGAPPHRGLRRRPRRQHRVCGRPANARRARGRVTTHFVQSLQRGLSVIRAFDADAPQLTLSEVARRTGLTRAAARRFLLTLEDLGYVTSDGRDFSLTPRVLELGYAYLSSISLPEVAEPHLERLVAEVRESSSVSVLDGGDIVYVARVPVSRIMTVSINVGTRFPAYATSMGRVLLSGLDDEALDAYLAEVELARLSPKTVTSANALRAELERVRTQGWAMVDQELEEGLRAVAVPIRDRDARVVAAANISAHASRSSPEVIRRDLLPQLLATAARIEADLRVAVSSTRRRPAGG